MGDTVLFTIESFSGDKIPIFGPTNQNLNCVKPVDSNVKYGNYIVTERNKKLKLLENWKVRNKYFKENRLQDLENEKKQIIMLTNWKLRVLNEQHNERLKKEKQLKDIKIKERSEKAKNTRDENKKKYAMQEPRRSPRLSNKND